jgi:hypothetical protein
MALGICAVGLALLSLYAADRAAKLAGKRIWNILK